MTGTNTAELAYRASDGVEVSLLWSERGRRLTVVVSDSRAAHSFELTAHPENALDVFHHPYAYAAVQGII
jgi:hypothetical protein